MYTFDLPNEAIRYDSDPKRHTFTVVTTGEYHGIDPIYDKEREFVYLGNDLYLYKSGDNYFRRVTEALGYNYGSWDSAHPTPWARAYKEKWGVWPPALIWCHQRGKLTSWNPETMKFEGPMRDVGLGAPILVRQIMREFGVLAKKTIDAGRATHGDWPR